MCYYGKFGARPNSQTLSYYSAPVIVKRWVFLKEKMGEEKIGGQFKHIFIALLKSRSVFRPENFLP